jgi:predicted acylesterase/phospholipase RssA
MLKLVLIMVVLLAELRLLLCAEGHTHRKDPPKWIALQGGGVKGIAIGGAIRGLEQAFGAKFLRNIKGYAGTSAGSQAAMLLAAGYNGAELTDALRTIDFKELLTDSYKVEATKKRNIEKLRDFYREAEKGGCDQKDKWQGCQKLLDLSPRDKQRRSKCEAELFPDAWMARLQNWFHDFSDGIKCTNGDCAIFENNPCFMDLKSHSEYSLLRLDKQLMHECKKTPELQAAITRGQAKTDLLQSALESIEVGPLQAYQHMHRILNRDSYCRDTNGNDICDESEQVQMMKDLCENEIFAQMNLPLCPSPKVGGRFSLHEGGGLENELENRLTNCTNCNGHRPKITFEELHKTTGKVLRLVATNLQTKSLMWMDHLSVANMSIAKAARASSSIPFYFDPVEHNGAELVDGGMKLNLPYSAFDDGLNGKGKKSTEVVLALHFTNDEESTKTASNVMEYIEKLAETTVFGEDTLNSVSAAKKRGDIELLDLYTGNVGAVDFEIDEDTKAFLVLQGWCGAVNWYSNSNISTPTDECRAKNMTTKGLHDCLNSCGAKGVDRSDMAKMIDERTVCKQDTPPKNRLETHQDTFKAWLNATSFISFIKKTLTLRLTNLTEYRAAERVPHGTSYQYLIAHVLVWMELSAPHVLVWMVLSAACIDKQNWIIAGCIVGAMVVNHLNSILGGEPSQRMDSVETCVLLCMLISLGVPNDFSAYHSLKQVLGYVVVFFVVTYLGWMDFNKWLLSIIGDSTFIFLGCQFVLFVVVIMVAHFVARELLFGEAESIGAGHLGAGTNRISERVFDILDPDARDKISQSQLESFFAFYYGFQTSEEVEANDPPCMPWVENGCDMKPKFEEWMLKFSKNEDAEAFDLSTRTPMLTSAAFYECLRDFAHVDFGDSDSTLKRCKKAALEAVKTTHPRETRNAKKPRKRATKKPRRSRSETPARSSSKTMNQFPTKYSEHFEQIDTNNDGKITKDEMNEFFKKNAYHSPLLYMSFLYNFSSNGFEIADSNNDGKDPTHLL